MFDKPFPFLDSDVYKWLEGAGWELGRTATTRPSPRWPTRRSGSSRPPSVPDGYLNTFVQVLAPGTEYRDLALGPRAVLHRPSHPGSHFLAPCARRRSSPPRRRACGCLRRARARARRTGGDRRPSRDRDGARRAVPGDRRAAPPRAGRRLHRAARARACSGAAGSVRATGRTTCPVREAPSVVGHAVRQLYLDCGAVDVAVERATTRLLDAVMRRWRDMVDDEDVPDGRPRQPPQGRGVRRSVRAAAGPSRTPRRAPRSPRSCSPGGCCSQPATRTVPTSSSGRPTTAILSVALARRDGVLLRQPAPAADAPAPGRSRRTGERAAWYACACCPPNLMRTVALVAAAPRDDDGRAASRSTSTRGRDLGRRRAAGRSRPTTRGRATWPSASSRRRTSRGSSRCAFRPGASRPILRDAAGSEIGRRSGDGRAIAERRTWRAGDALVLSLDMPVRVTSPHPRVDAVRGCVALERGPLVYAVETADLPARHGARGARRSRTRSPRPRSTDPDLGPSVVGLRASGLADGAPVDFEAVPVLHVGQPRGRRDARLDPEGRGLHLAAAGHRGDGA